MKRYGIVLSISVLLALAATTASFAQYPPPGQTVVLPMGAGWFDDTQVWFVSAAAADIDPAAAAPVYVTVNPTEPQGPVFSTAPGPAPYWAPPYSSVWRVVQVAWSPWATRIPLTSEQQITNMAADGMLSLRETGATVRYPIVVVGLLGDPLYVAPEVLGVDFVRARVELPAWRVYDWNDNTAPAGSGQITVAAGGTANDNSGSGPFDILMRMALFPITPQGTVLTDWTDVLNPPASTGSSGT